MKEELKTIRASIEAFETNFSRFWEISAKTQMYGQIIGALEERIGGVPDGESQDLKDFCHELKEKYEAGIEEIFAIMRSISGSDDCSPECYDLLNSANEVICVNFARLAAQNNELTRLFLNNHTEV